MKRKLLYIAAIIIALVVLDKAFGMFMRTVEPYSYNQNSLCYQNFNSDVLILGASSSVFDISPNVIEKEMGMSCYCGGEGGNGSIVAWARYNMCLRQHKPKIIIYCVTPQYDAQNDGEGTVQNSLNVLQDYYGRDSVVTEIFRDIKSPVERIKYNSNFVKYNPEWIRTIVHAVTGSKKYAKGHGAYYGTFIPLKDTPEREKGPFAVDSVKLKYLTMFFTDIKRRGITLYCLLAPKYYDVNNPKSYTQIFNLCHRLNVPVIDNGYFPQISGHPEYFYDSAHLNEIGAQAYTTLLCKEIKELTNKRHEVSSTN